MDSNNISFYSSVVPASNADCQIDGDNQRTPSYINGSSGSSCGATWKPWTIRVPPTKNIQLSLLDFTEKTASGYYCVNYGRVNSQTNICGGKGIRESPIPHSIQNILEIYLSASNMHRFLIKFEGKCIFPLCVPCLHTTNRMCI